MKGKFEDPIAHLASAHNGSPELRMDFGNGFLRTISESGSAKCSVGFLTQLINPRS